MSDTTKKRKRGPAKKPEEQQRKNRISIFLTDSEYRLVKEKAGDYELPLYVRTRAINGKLAPKAASIPAINLEAWRNLAQCANNLNQLARHLNAGNELGIDEAKAEIAAFRLALISLGDQP